MGRRVLPTPGRPKHEGLWVTLPAWQSAGSVTLQA